MHGIPFEIIRSIGSRLKEGDEGVCQTALFLFFQQSIKTTLDITSLDYIEHSIPVVPRENYPSLHRET